MRILLVEDDKSLSKVVTALLKKNNYTVENAFDGREAISLLSSDDFYDAVILDFMLPFVDGLTVLKTIRQNKNDIPVLILSAKSEIDDKCAGLDSGANDYLTKPFDSKELLARLRVLLRKKEITNDSVLTIENLNLDSASYTVSTVHGSYRLVGKEYQLLQYFMTNFNTVISAQKLMEKIWEADSEATLNTVWTYIAYLRRKLESLKSDVQIATKRNSGYIMQKI